MAFPLQKLMELNVRTMQSMSYIKPDDLLKMKKPEDLFEKNLGTFIQNTHMALNYIKDTFSILENHWLNVSQNTEKNAINVVHKASSVAKKTIKKSASSAKNMTNKVAASVKSNIKKSVKAASKESSKAKTGAKKIIKTMKPVTHHSKPNVQQGSKNGVKRSTDKLHAKAKDDGNFKSRAANMQGTSSIKDLGLLYKGTNSSNR